MGRVRVLYSYPVFISYRREILFTKDLLNNKKNDAPQMRGSTKIILDQSIQNGLGFSISSKTNSMVGFR